MSKLRLLDLFSGIGGFSLGLERTGGFETVAFCEIEEFPRRVLAKHWPKVPCYHDIRDLTADALASDGIGVDAICGGFPCQDISTAGKGAGIEGERSGLWSEYARLIGELRPRVVFVENVAALLGRGLDRVLGDLAALGYDAEWHCIPASAVGAPHRRDRFWIVAYSVRSKRWSEHSSCGHVQRQDGLSQRQEGSGGFEPDGQTLADTPSQRRREARQDSQRSAQWSAGRSDVSDTLRLGPQGQGRAIESVRPEARLYREIHRAIHDSGWPAEPNVGRVAHGVPDRSHRLKALGNAVVPQIPELLGNAYLQSLEAQS